MRAISGSSGDKLTDKSWSKVHEETAGERVHTCAVDACNRPARVAAHVQTASDPDAAYLVRTCHQHNSVRTNGGMDLKPDTPAVKTTRHVSYRKNEPDC